MTVHYYFIPLITVGTPPMRSPKYSKSPTNPAGFSPYRSLPYGNIDVALVTADIDLTTHQALCDAADVLSVDPRNGIKRDLDGLAVQGEIDALSAYLESAGNFVPMHWANTTQTRRYILRQVAYLFLFMQRLTQFAGSAPTTWGITFTTTWAQLTAEQQEWINATLASFNYTGDPVPGGATMRQILRGFMAVYGDVPVGMGIGGML